MAQLQSPARLTPAKRMPTWEMEIPDIDLFSIPVDDFFDSYVEQLGARGMQQGHEESTGVVAGNSGDYESTTEALGSQLPLPTAQAYNFQDVQAFVPVASQPAVHLSQHLPHPQSQNNAGNVITSGYAGIPLMTSAPLQVHHDAAPHQDAKAGLHGSEAFSSGGFGSGGFEDFRSGDDDMGNGHGEGLGRGGEAAQDGRPHKEGARGKRNPRQQVQNKQAQQRYRERRKTRFLEMEQAIDSLTGQVKDLQSMQSQNLVLQSKATELETRLAEREAEIERLRTALRVIDPRPTQSSGSTRSAGGLSEDDADCSGMGMAEEPRTVREREMAEYHELFRQNNEALAAFVADKGLRALPPSGVGVAVEVVQACGELVMRGCKNMARAMRAEGIKVLELMSKDVGQLTRIECQKERTKWLHILDVVQLSPTQRDELMSMRKAHLRNLRKLYEDRQQLNLQAMALMLPPARRSGANGLGGGVDEQGIDCKMRCMTLNGYSFCARKNVDLAAVLDAIKDNLRQEQQTVMALNFQTMHRTLSPIQAALFIVEAYPGYCDCLALANILASSLGRENSGAGELGPGERPALSSDDSRSETCPLKESP